MAKGGFSVDEGKMGGTEGPEAIRNHGSSRAVGEAGEAHQGAKTQEAGERSAAKGTREGPCSQVGEGPSNPKVIGPEFDFQKAQYSPECCAFFVGVGWLNRRLASESTRLNGPQGTR